MKTFPIAENLISTRNIFLVIGFERLDAFLTYSTQYLRVLVEIINRLEYPAYHSGNASLDFDIGLLVISADNVDDGHKATRGHTEPTKGNLFLLHS